MPSWQWAWGPRAAESGTTIHFFTSVTTSQWETHAQSSQAISDRPYAVALILAVDLETRHRDESNGDRSGVASAPTTLESQTTKHTKLPMIGLIQSVADGI